MISEATLREARRNASSPSPRSNSVSVSAPLRSAISRSRGPTQNQLMM